MIFGGQSLALLLTLLVTPVAYSLFDDASKLRLFGRRRARREVVGGVPSAAPAPAPRWAAPRSSALLAARPCGRPPRRRPRAQAPATLRLTVDEAVKMALEHNVDLTADRLDPQISDTRVAAAAGAFRPTINTERPVATTSCSRRRAS